MFRIYSLLIHIIKITRNCLPSISPQNVTVNSTVCGTRWCCMTVGSCYQYKEITKKFMHFVHLHVWVICNFVLFRLDNFEFNLEGNEFHGRHFLEGSPYEGTQTRIEMSTSSYSCLRYQQFCTFPGRWPWNWHWRSTSFTVIFSWKVALMKTCKMKKLIQMGFFVFASFTVLKSWQTRTSVLIAAHGANLWLCMRLCVVHHWDYFVVFLVS
jgi:hypothetical protein